MHRSILCSTLAVALAAATAAAQVNPKPDSTAKVPTGLRVPVPAYRNRIVGVFDGQTYQPIDGVEVRDVMAGNKSLTSTTGNVSLFFLPEGASLVRVRKLGYESQTFMVEISPRDSSPITIVLSHVTELPPVVTTDSSPRHISPGLREFDERKKAGFGYFIDEAQLRKDEGRQLSNEVVAHIPGVIVKLNGQVLSGRTGAACPVTIFLDGVMVYGGSKSKSPPPDLAHMETNDYAGIEFYSGPATIPPQYNVTASGCGALLLWTRER